MRRLWRKQPVLTLAFMLAAALTLFFIIRTTLFAIYWADPQNALHPVEDWMTPRYIVHAYDLQPEAVAAALAIPPRSSPRLPLADIAKARGVPVEELIAAVESLLDRGGAE